MLSSLYNDWMDQFLGGPIPTETLATCDDCAMLPQPGMPPGFVFFHPETKCCTYEPALANYRIGLILSDDDPELAAGRRTVEERIRKGVAITPWGLHMPAPYQRRYKRDKNAFGRDPALLCPHYVEGRCGIWRHNPAPCSTWFCKHVRGFTGRKFWIALSELLREIDAKMGTWCALELGIQADPAAVENKGELWGVWAGQEAQLFRACAQLVSPLQWDDVARISGPGVMELSDRVREQHAQLTSPAMLENPLMGLVQIEGMVAGKCRAATYSPYDPLRISPELVDLLSHFDGRRMDEVLEEIRVQRGIRLAPALVRRMADFRVLVESAGEEVRNRPRMDADGH
jgi:hypothetical protein